MALNQYYRFLPGLSVLIFAVLFGVVAMRFLLSSMMLSNATTNISSWNQTDNLKVSDVQIAQQALFSSATWSPFENPEIYGRLGLVKEREAFLFASKDKESSFELLKEAERYYALQTSMDNLSAGALISLLRARLMLNADRSKISKLLTSLEDLVGVNSHLTWEFLLTTIPHWKKLSPAERVQLTTKINTILKQRNHYSTNLIRLLKFPSINSEFCANKVEKNAADNLYKKFCQ